MAGFGETLRQARAHKGVTLKEAEQATRINRHHLAALEEENFDALPPLIYQRGIVRNYSVYLELDPGKMLARFEESHGTIVEPVAAGGVAAMPPVDMPSHWAPNFAIIAFSVVLSAIVFAWVYSAYVAPSDETPTATMPVPTMTPFDNDIVIPTDPAPSPTATAAPTEKPQPTATTSNPAASGDNQVGTREPATTNSSTEGRGDNQRSQTQDASAIQPNDQIAPAETATTESDGDTASRNQDRIATANANGSPLGGITITANEDIVLTVTVDGTVEFDGTLAAGSTTDEFIGTNYEITTSSGTNTLFTDACGYQFNMGYEVGNVTYSFPADGSCTP